MVLVSMATKGRQPQVLGFPPIRGLACWFGGLKPRLLEREMENYLSTTKPPIKTTNPPPIRGKPQSRGEAGWVLDFVLIQGWLGFSHFGRSRHERSGNLPRHSQIGHRGDSSTLNAMKMGRSNTATVLHFFMLISSL